MVPSITTMLVKVRSGTMDDKHAYGGQNGLMDNNHADRGQSLYHGSML